MDKPLNIPIISALTAWLRGHTTDLKMTMAVNGNSVSIYHDKNWLGVVTLIYPGQEERQGLQYDWYASKDTWALIHFDHRARYYRSTWMVADPQSFTEVLATANLLRAELPVKWHQTYRPSAKGIVLLETSDA